MTVRNQQGFSLIEVIVALTLSSIVAAMLYSNFHLALTNSVTPLEDYQKTLSLHTTAENMIADFSSITEGGDTISSWQPSYEYHIGNIVKSTRKFGHIFKCIQNGQSSLVEPQWRTDNTAIDDGETQWQEEKSQLIEIKQNIISKEYGEYEVVQADLIKFEFDTDKFIEKTISSDDHTSPHNLLKVIIRNNIDQQLTILFSSTY